MEFYKTKDGRIINIINETLCRDLTDNKTMGYTKDNLEEKLSKEDLNKYKVTFYNEVAQKNLTRYMTEENVKIYIDNSNVNKRIK